MRTPSPEEPSSSSNNNNNNNNNSKRGGRQRNRAPPPYTVRSIGGSNVPSIMQYQPTQMPAMQMQMGQMGMMGMGNMQQQQQFMPVPQTEIKVAGETNIKNLANQVAQMIRGSGSVALLAIGAGSINQAVKAMAVCNDMANQVGMDLACFPELRVMPSADSQNALRGSAMKFVVHRRHCRKSKLDATSELKVASTSEPRTVAGSVSAKIREGERLNITAIGPQSVCQTAKALAMSRSFLEEDGLDVSFRPEWVHIDSFSDGTRSGIKFVILAQQA